jgi:hypothetical protein
MRVRYQCLRLTGRWSWRLLGGNHRELARAVGDFATQAQAAQDALAVGRLAATAPIEASVGGNTSWRWVLLVDDEARAASTVPYARRLECLRAVSRFRAWAPLAEVDPTPLIRRDDDRTRRARQSPL